MHPERPDRALRGGEDAARPSDGPPFRRLRSGRRRSEPTAPYDAHIGGSAARGQVEPTPGEREADAAPPRPTAAPAAVPGAGVSASSVSDSAERRPGRRAVVVPPVPAHSAAIHSGEPGANTGGQPEGPRAGGAPLSGDHGAAGTANHDGDAADHGSADHDGEAAHHDGNASDGHDGETVHHYGHAADGPDDTHHHGDAAEGHDDTHAWDDAGEYAEEAPGVREHIFLPTGGKPTGATTSLRRQRRRRRNIVMLVVVGVFALGVAGIVLFLQSLLGQSGPEDYPGPGEGEVAFTVEPGWGPLQIARRLEEQDIVASVDLFLEAIQEVDSETKEIHPGDYQLQYRMPALEAAEAMVDAGERVGYVGIKQNLRTGAVFDEISKSTGIPVADLQALNDKPAEFGITGPAKNLEGYLHPGEYRFPVESEAKDVLQLLVDATLEKLEASGVTDPEEQYRVLKVASILQAEARPNDYRTVAGALENRLHPDNRETAGLLQVDSAVIYGLDRYTLQITESEKTDAGNPYNTYVHPGLPPTPIGSPADSAIDAAVNPEENGYYYWVTVDTTTGETKFAETYAEHRIYQQEFRDWCAANTEICK